MKLIFSVLTFLLCSQSFASSPFQSISRSQSQLGFSKYYSETNSNRPLRVAVLDQGFEGYQAEIGKSLPANTKYVAGPVTPPPELKVEHGLRMAQILMAFMTNEGNANQWQPELTLYNVFGFSNFQSAITDLIAKKVDVVLYSEVWEYGGNNDGKGFINAQVNRATKAGVLWVNAAGNFGLTTYNGAIKTMNDNWVQLPDQNQSLAFRCEKNQNNKCPVKVVLTWNDFKDDIDPGTDKDLDIALSDDLLNVVQSSALSQSKDPKESRPGYSKYPREIIAAELKPGLYFLRVKNRSNNFTSSDRLRITIDGDSITMPSHSSDETVLNPGDNASVISVGASDSDRSPVSVRNKKPDIYAPSSMKLASGDEFRGTSNSAAIVAAGVALLKTQHNDWDKDEVLKHIRAQNQSYGNWNQGGLPLSLLGFGPTSHTNNAACFVEGQFSPLPDYVQTILDLGGVLVQTTAALRIMTPFDPIQLSQYLRRIRVNDMIVINSQGLQIYPRGAPMPLGSVEIFQRPLEAGLCHPPLIVPQGKTFGLPQ